MTNATRTPAEVITYLQGCKDNLLQQKIDNHAAIGQLERQVWDLENKLKHLSRHDQSLGLSLSQVNQQLKDARNKDFEPKLIDEMKKVVDKDTFLKCIEAARK